MIEQTETPTETEEQVRARDSIHKYRYLTKLERSDPKDRCGFLMENGMQCPMFGYIELLNDKMHFLCAFHTANAMAVADSKHETYTEVKD